MKTYKVKMNELMAEEVASAIYNQLSLIGKKTDVESRMARKELKACLKQLGYKATR